MGKRHRLHDQRRRISRLSFYWFLGLLCFLITVLWAHSTAQNASSPALASSVTQTISNQGPAPIATLEPGRSAPDLTLSIARGGIYHLAEHQGHVIALTFLITQPDTLASPSRNQVVSLLSMQHQYGTKGVDMILVDESPSITGITRQNPPTLSTLLNVTYDWNLGSMPLLADDASNTIARQYGVQQLPTTFLISASGRVVQRWNGEVPPAQLGLALQKLTGTL